MEEEPVVTIEDKTLTMDALVDEALALGAHLGRPLRYVQINSFYNGSTGSIMRLLHKGLSEGGVDSYIFWGRRHETINDREQCCATKLGYLSHGVKTRLFDRMGFYSKGDTARLLKRLDEIKPDVVHLHNIHGYYINVEMLFEWLASQTCQVRWTLHDCWAFTGHCAHFAYTKCAQWRSHCALNKPCPQLNTYPKTVSKHSCAKNYEDKRRIFNMLPVDRMKLVSPSHWLEGLVRQSFLSKYPVEVRHNTIDATVFKPTPSDFREKYGIGNRFMILGVASPWTERKGLGDFMRLAKTLDDKKFAIVLVGLSEKQMKALPEGVLGLYRTESQRDLAGIYSTADILFNPTVEDNFPTVNLEAEACGTPVMTYNTGGCAETIGRIALSKVVSSEEEALSSIEAIRGLNLGCH